MYHHTYNFWFSGFELNAIGAISSILLGDGVGSLSWRCAILGFVDVFFPSNREPGLSASSWPLCVQKQSLWKGRDSPGDLVCGQEQERLRTRELGDVRNPELMGEDLVDQGFLGGVQSLLSGRAFSKCFARREKSSEFSVGFLPDREGIWSGDDDAKVSTEPSSSDNAECSEDDVTSGGLLERGGRKSFSTST